MSIYKFYTVLPKELERSSLLLGKNCESTCFEFTLRGDWGLLYAIFYVHVNFCE